MISWDAIAFGALLSALLAAGGVFVFGGERRGRVAITAGLVTGLSAAGWNAVAHVTKAAGLSSAAPFAAFPIAWTDACAGVWALAGVTVVLGTGLRRSAKAAHLMLLALLCGVAALLTAVYLY